MIETNNLLVGTPLMAIKNGKKDNSDTKLGEIFCQMPFEFEPQQRIVGLLVSNSLPREVLIKYGPKTEPYQIFAKKERIPGFRSGTAPFSERLMHRIIESMSTPKVPQYEICWDIYKYAAIRFVTTELKTLNKLLSEITSNESNDDVNDLFKSICINAGEFEVKATDVRKLYEVWWTDRIANFEDMLSLCSQLNEARVQAKNIAKISKDIDEVKKSHQDLGKRIAEQTALAKQINDQTTKDRERILANEVSIKAFDIKVAEFATGLTRSTDSRFKIIENSLHGISDQIADEKRYASINEKIKKFESELKRVSEENNQALASFERLCSNMMASANAVSIAKIDELEKSMTTISGQLADKLDKGAGPLVSPLGAPPYKSPLSAVNTLATSSFKINKEGDFLNSWSATLERKYQLLLPPEELVAYYALLLSSRVVISEYNLLETWVHSLGWWQFVRQIVASPLWSREKDWAEGLDHLFKEEGVGKTPRIVIIHNYDAGAVDCYLVPSLILWALRANNEGVLTKLFLIPTQPGTVPNFQVLEHAAYIEAIGSLSQNKLRFKEVETRITPLRSDIPIGVDPQIFKQWSRQGSSASYDLSSIQKPFDLELNEWLKKNFQNTVSCAGKFFQEPCAVGLGMYHQILPWVKSRYESKYEALCARVSELPDIVYL